MSMTRRRFLQLLGVASASVIGVGTYNLWKINNLSSNGRDFHGWR